MRKGRIINGPNVVRFAILGVVFLGCFSAGGGYGIIRGLMMSGDPAFSEANLRGLTRDQVLQRLGKATSDPAWIDSRGKSAATRPWDETSEGPYYLAYYRGSGTCVIRFTDGRVSSVQHSMK